MQQIQKKCRRLSGGECMASLFAFDSNGSHIVVMSKRKSTQRWRVSRIRGSKNEVVGTVLAPDREAAIREAIEQHQITDPEKQRRLVAWPEA